MPTKETMNNANFLITAAAITSLAEMLCMPSSAFADSLDFKGVPVSEAIGCIDKTFNVTLDLKKGIDLRRKITFSVDNPHNDGAVLDAVNSLANAVDADYRKVFVITKDTGDGKAQDPIIDAGDAPVVFDRSDMTATKAIELVAGVDSASVQMSTSLEMPVKLSGTSLTAMEAARQIARQTHTDWNIHYVFTPRNAQGGLPGKIIGYTDSGQPILEMPNLTFRKPKPDPIETTMPSVQQNLNSSYWSAILRGDRSAMTRFQQQGATISDPPLDSTFNPQTN